MLAVEFCVYSKWRIPQSLIPNEHPEVASAN